MNLTTVPDIHIGNIILDYIDKNRISKAELARFIKMDPANLSRLLKKKSMETDKLVEICQSLSHNFFALWTGEPEMEQDIAVTIESPKCIGQLIDNRLNSIKMTQVEFSGHLGVKQPEITKIIRKTSINTDKLAVISRILDYNFFKDFYFKEEIPDVETQDNNHVAYLVSCIKDLTIENDHLKQDLQLSKEEIERLKKIIVDAGLKYK